MLNLKREVLSALPLRVVERQTEYIVSMVFTLQHVLNFHLQAMNSTCQRVKKTHYVRGDADPARVIMQSYAVVRFSQGLV